jgi:8-oxo-dGTP pyrophosphatase MutT (NUDIX family)
MPKKLRKSVQVIPYRRQGSETEFLILHRVRNWTGWEFPKGGIEPREGFRQAALRELEEECSLKGSDIVSMRPASYGFVINYSKEYRKKSIYDGAEFKILIAELSRKARTDISKNIVREHDAFRWLPEGRAAKLLRSDLRGILKRAARSIGRS